MYSEKELIGQLNAMNVPRDGIVLMHSSLRCIGEVEGGGEAVLDLLIRYFTEKGGLFCVPTPTVRNLLDGKEITLDMNSAENDLGVLSKLAAMRTDGIRSENPLLSMVVFGDRARAEAFVRDDAFITTPTAKESCYGKLATWGGYILLVGVGHEKSTYLHSVAELLDMEDRMDTEEQRVGVKRLSGEIILRKMRLYKCSKTIDVSRRFPKYEIAFRYHGGIVDGFFGDAPVQFCDAKIMKDTVSYILQNSGGEDPLGTDLQIPPIWFCKKK